MNPGGKVQKIPVFRYESGHEPRPDTVGTTCERPEMISGALALIGAAFLKFSPACDTAYMYRLDHQFDSARISYSEALRSPSRPLDALIGLMFTAWQDPADTVAVFPPDTTNAAAHFLHLYSKYLSGSEGVEFVSFDRTPLPEDSELASLFHRDSSLLHSVAFRAWLLRRKYQTTQALASLKSVRERGLGNPVFDLEYVDALVASGEWVEADSECRRLMALYARRPLHGLFRLRWIESHKKLKDYDTLLTAALDMPAPWKDDVLLNLAEQSWSRKDTALAIRYYQEALELGWNNSTRPSAQRLALLYRHDMKDVSSALRVYEKYEKAYGRRYESIGREWVKMADEDEMPDSYISYACRMAIENDKGTRAVYYGVRDIRRAWAKSLIRVGHTGEAFTQLDIVRAQTVSRIERLENVFWVALAYVVWQPPVLTAWTLTYLLSILVFPLALVYFFRLPAEDSTARRAAIVVSSAILILQFVTADVINTNFWSWTIFSALRNFVVIYTALALLSIAGFQRRMGFSGMLETLLVVALGGLWTRFLIQVETPDLSPVMKTISDMPSEFGMPPLEGPPQKALAYVVAAAFTEESICRLLPAAIAARAFGLRRNVLTAALTLSTLAWAAAHAGTVSPEWWKFAQVSGLGALLSVLFVRRGFWACLAAHALFNAAAVLVE
ncbi:CPBP family intramembrane metalloprotease [bacterium]|nr:CPBP family intramembrane metalloprotease [bacterium]